jgi:hypothetical protein
MVLAGSETPVCRSDWSPPFRVVVQRRERITEACDCAPQKSKPEDDSPRFGNHGISVHAAQGPSEPQLLINALTGQVGTGTSLSG